MTVPAPVEVTISPEPSPAELAAVLAAYRELWPVPPAAPSEPATNLRWRFSGRWWNDSPMRKPAIPHSR